MSELPDASRRVADAAQAAGLAIDIKVMTASTRTAEEAAAACDCRVGQIVKSLVFKGATSGRGYLLLVSGSNRVDEAKVASTLGETIIRPDARFVRDLTGFAIGGIPPFGHATPIATSIDRDLLDYDRVYAAAGTPSTIFSVDPKALAAATGAAVISVA